MVGLREGYNDDTPDMVYNQVRLSRKINYEWRIGTKLLQLMKNAEPESNFFSDNFGLNEDRLTFSPFKIDSHLRRKE